MKLTVSAAAGLKLPRGKHDHIVFDDDIAGFGLRLRERRAYWILQYTITSDGQAQGQAKQKKRLQRRITFGTYPAMSVPKAREQAAKLHAEVKLGHDPQAAKKDSQARAGESFEACLRIYLERRRSDVKLRPSSYREIERHLDRNLKALHGLRIDKVDRRAIALELDRLTANGAVQANRTLASLRKFLSWCAGQVYIDVNAAQFINKNSEQSRDRVLTDAELRTVWHALPKGDYCDIVRLLMLTGQRASEIGDLAWDEIDLDRAVIVLPPTRTKNRRRHAVPLSAPALDILKARVPKEGRSHVFGIGQGGFAGWSRCKARLDAAVQIKPFVVHDLRRSVASGLGDCGVEPYIVEQVLNHQSGAKSGVSGLYNKSSYEPQKTTALNLWADHLMAAIENRQSNIKPLKRA
jgi:integrase